MPDGTDIRIPTATEYNHERLRELFATTLTDYDTRRRLEVLIDRFLPHDLVEGVDAMDVGCGLGFISKRTVNTVRRIWAPS